MVQHFWRCFTNPSAARGLPFSATYGCGDGVARYLGPWDKTKCSKMYIWFSVYGNVFIWLGLEVEGIHRSDIVSSYLLCLVVGMSTWRLKIKCVCSRNYANGCNFCPHCKSNLCLYNVTHLYKSYDNFPYTKQSCSNIWHHLIIWGHRSHVHRFVLWMGFCFDLYKTISRLFTNHIWSIFICIWTIVPNPSLAAFG